MKCGALSYWIPRPWSGLNYLPDQYFVNVLFSYIDFHHTFTVKICAWEDNRGLTIRTYDFIEIKSLEKKKYLPW